MEITLKGIVRYDGSRFAGWQVQPRRRTVQGEMEAAFSRVASQPIRVQGAGRTDSGVHALGQVFSCRWPRPVSERLRHALSQMLSPEIRIVELIEAPETFNARYDALSKRYVYTIDLGREPDPFCAPYAWHVPYRTSMDLITSLLPRIEGRHDFAGFQGAGSPRPETERTLFEARCTRGAMIGPADAANVWRLSFHGDAFLYRMVRNLTGTLIEIGRGRFSPEFLDECLQSPGPFAGHCAPAHGLVLEKVYY